MRKLFAALLAIAMIFTLCACGKGEPEEAERDCGVFITVEASDIYTVSCGTSKGSESCTNADGSAIEPGTVLHFDFAGDDAKSSDEVIIDFSVCAYDADLEIITDSSFSNDFSRMAKYNLVITEDHHILYEGQEYSSGGDIIVSYDMLTPENDISIMGAKVTMATRPEIAELINSSIDSYNNTFSGEQYKANKEAYGKDLAEGATPEAFSMSRTVRVMRGDSSVLSFRIADRANLGAGKELSIIAYNYNTQTGEEIKLADIARDVSKFTDYCSERVLVATTEEERFLTEDMIFVDGYTDNIRSLISDGHWYFNSEGIVIAANPGDISSGYYEFDISYEDLTPYIKEDYVPGELKGSYGNIALQLAKNVNMDGLTLLGDAPDESIDSMLLTVAGNIYNVTVYTGTYNAENSNFTPDKQLVYCSDMMRGAALAINHAPKESIPDLMISFTTPDGTIRNLLACGDEANGGLLLMELEGGNEGIIVKGTYKYDLNGDGNEETIKLNKGETVSVLIGRDTVSTEIKSGESLRLYDLNGDGMMEVYLSGEAENGKTMTYCFIFDGSAVQLGEPIDGVVSEFNGNRLFVLANLNILGTHSANVAYFYSPDDSKLLPMSGFEYIFDDGEVITTALAMALKDGTNLPPNTRIHLKSTDGESYVNITTDEGVSGTLSITKDTVGEWTVNGQPASACFKNLT